MARQQLQQQQQQQQQQQNKGGRSRKELRQAQRGAKKANRARAYESRHNELRKERKREREEIEKAEAAAAVKRAKAYAKKRAKRELTPEEQEIEYLERKLGISGANLSQGKNRDRLKKELAEDGLPPDILDFLDVLDTGGSIAAFDKKMAKKEKVQRRYADEGDDDEGSDDEIHVANANGPAFDEQVEDALKQLMNGGQFSDEDGEGDDSMLVVSDEEEEDDDDEEDRSDDESQSLADRGSGEEDGQVIEEEGSDQVEDEDEDEDDEEEESQAESDGESIGGGEEDFEDDQVQDEDEDDEPVVSNATFLPKEDLYGRKSGKASEEGQGRANSRLFKNSGESLRVRKLLNGLVNRLTEANVQPVANEIVGVYRENPRLVVSECLASILLSGLNNELVVLGPLATTFATLVTAVSILHDSTFGAFFLEKAVLRFEKVWAEDCTGVEQDGGERVVSKRAANLAVLLSHMFTFQVTSSGLLFDLVDKMVAELSEDSAEVILAVINECGHKMRKEDPARLVQVVKALQAKQEENSAGLSARMEFLLEEVYALKNNKKRNEAVEDRTRRLSKLLKFLSTNGSPVQTLKLQWDELKHGEERGRWWIVGGVWKDQDRAIQLNKERAAKLGGEGRRGGGGGSIQQALARADPAVLKLARKQRMNTDVRRAIFCVLMTADDVINGYERLMSLNLDERQQREIVHVIVRCCSASKDYNIYFAELSTHLCTNKPSFRFTYQLALWDLLKELEAFSARKLNNLAHLFAHLVLYSSLPLVVIRVVDFMSLSDEGILFFNVFFQALLCHGGDNKEGARRVARAFNYTGGSKHFPAVSDGIQFFFRQHLPIKARVPPKEQKHPLLAKRAKIAMRILEALTITREAEEHKPDEIDPDADLEDYGL